MIREYAQGHKHDPTIETRGGNSIDVGSRNLHAEWDQTDKSLDPTTISPQLVARAKALPINSGRVSDWATVWATDTVKASQLAFGGISYTRPGKKGKWAAQFSDRKQYLAMKRKIQAEQIEKAGAHLAQVLNAIWP